MRISEDFYSVQGEGISQGLPAYFVRLQGCNLMCGGSQAELVKEGKASWWCDTEDIWKKGEDRSNEWLVERFKSSGQLENILSGKTHIIWTGGEPTLPYHIKSISDFQHFMDKSYPENSMYEEIETNGAVITPENWYEDHITQINCSPKLSNSGMEKGRRINPIALKQITNHPYSWFKFVVSSEKDIEEIQTDFITPYDIQADRVIIMPASDSMRTLPDSTRLCYDLTKKYGYRSVSRGQVLAWNRTTGV